MRLAPGLWAALAAAFVATHGAVPRGVDDAMVPVEDVLRHMERRDHAELAQKIESGEKVRQELAAQMRKLSSRMKRGDEARKELTAKISMGDQDRKRLTVAVDQCMTSKGKSVSEPRIANMQRLLAPRGVQHAPRVATQTLTISLNTILSFHLPLSSFHRPRRHNSAASRRLGAAKADAGCITGGRTHCSTFEPSCGGKDEARPPNFG